MYALQQSQYHSQTNQKQITERDAKHTKESNQWLNQTFTSNCYTALLEEESEDKQQKAGPENTPIPPPIYIYN
jgi:hypothetical protein